MTIQFGVEFECKGLTVNEARDAMEAAGVDFYNNAGLLGYHTRVPSNYWKAERDSSLGANATETSKGYMEIISPILTGENGVRIMKKVARELTRRGGKVDNLCGTHVTVGVNNSARWARFSDARKIEAGVTMQRIYAHFANVFDAISPDCRQMDNSSWCSRPVPGSNFSDRYQAVNLTAWVLYGRVEFRQPGFTLNGNKVALWLKLANAMTSAAINENHKSHSLILNDMPQTIDGIVDYLNLGEPTRRALVKRVEEVLALGTTRGRAALYNSIRRAVLMNYTSCISCGCVITNPLPTQNLCVRCD
jgi:hypothetical protein